MVIELNLLQTLALAVVLLIVGRVLKKKMNILEKFCIPAPVIGGVLFAFLTLAGYVSGTFELNMDFGLKTVLMVAFFTTVGFTASLRLLKKGGVQVGIFLVLALILVILQNVVGVSLATATSHLSEVPAASAIVDMAEELEADLIIMGTRGHTGLKHVLLGSVAERTLRHAPCSVLTVKVSPD